MILQIFSIYDDKGTIYCQPFFMQHQGIALRSFSDLVQDSQSSISHHPSDYHLYKLGEYDDNSGLLTPLKVPQFIAHAMEFVITNQNKNQNNNQCQPKESTPESQTNLNVKVNQPLPIEAKK